MSQKLITNLGSICPTRARVIALSAKEWNKHRTDLLHKMWQDNFTYSEMAHVLMVSRGAVAGKVKRMKAEWEGMA